MNKSQAAGKISGLHNLARLAVGHLQVRIRGDEYLRLSPSDPHLDPKPGANDDAS